jgi:hypothetical protein
MLTRTKATALVALVGLLSLGFPVLAQPGSDGLEPSLAVLEVYINGQDYPKTSEYSERIGDELTKIARFSLLERADAARQIGVKMRTSSRKATDDRLAEIEKIMKKGENLLLTDPQKAIELLANAKKQLRGVMDNLSLTHKIRKTYFGTQMRLARAHLDNDNEAKSSELLEEVIRVFGDEEPVTEDDYHPRLVELYKESARRFAKMDKGRVLVRTLPSGAEVLIQGSPRQKASPATYEGLYPGTVTVQARKGGQESMIHRVEIEANSTAEVTIDIDYENSLAFHTQGKEKRFGLVFSDKEKMKSRLAAFATRLGKVLKVDYILAVGLVDDDGRTNLEGYLVNATTGKLERTERLYTKANVVSKNRVRQMAMAMSNKGYTIERTYKPWFTNWKGWTGVGLAITGTIMGAIYLGKYDDDMLLVGDLDLPLLERTNVHAVNADKNRTIAGAGFVLAGLGAIGGTLAFLFLKDEDLDGRNAEYTLDKPLKLQAIAPLITPDSASVAASFSF